MDLDLNLVFLKDLNLVFLKYQYKICFSESNHWSGDIIESNSNITTKRNEYFDTL